METATPGGLNVTDVVLFLVLGGVLFFAAMAIRVKSGGKYEIKPMDLVLILVPLALWLFATGKITKFNVAGVEVELAQQFIKATENTIKFSPLETPKVKVEDVARIVERESKAGVERLPDLIKKKTEAIEFQLGYGRYWGPAIEKYFDALSTAGLLRYVLIYDEKRNLFGVYDARALYLHLESRGAAAYTDFEKYLNKNDEQSRLALSKLPGWISVDDAVTPDANNRLALESMERLNADFLPVIDDQRKFIGVVDRSRITASLVIDVTRAMESLDKTAAAGK
ncbi:hypothetical protein [Kaarinaea lacus]